MDMEVGEHINFMGIFVSMYVTLNTIWSSSATQKNKKNLRFFLIEHVFLYMKTFIHFIWISDLKFNNSLIVCRIKASLWKNNIEDLFLDFIFTKNNGLQGLNDLVQQSHY